MPERPFSVDRVCQWVLRCLQRDDAAIVVVAEGAVPQGGAELLATAAVDAVGHKRLGGVGIWLADQIAERTGAESRAVVLGHIQRGGTPTAYDRVLATRFGLQAVDAVHEGNSGVMVALRGTDTQDNGLALPSVLGNCAIASSFPCRGGARGGRQGFPDGLARLPNTDL